MSDKMECPGCDSYTSSVLGAFRNGDPCPYCGLSANAIVEVLAARKLAADADLTKRYADATIRADRAEKRAAELESAFGTIQRTLKKALGHE